MANDTLIYLKDNKFVMKHGGLASSSECCKCECEQACQCLKISDGTNIPPFGIKPFKFGPMIAGERDVGDHAKIKISCGPYAPDGNNAWCVNIKNKYQIGDDLIEGEWNAVLPSTFCECCPTDGGFGMELVAWGGNLEDVPAAFILEFYHACSPTACKWSLLDTTNGKTLQSGDIIEGDSETEFLLDGLEENWKPWGYYSKDFDVSLVINDCLPEDQKILETWSVSIGNCGNNRYPIHSLNQWTRKVCVGTGSEPCDEEILDVTFRPGGLTRSGRVTLFDQGEDREYSNIFNWKINGVRATYNNDLPDNSTNIEIQGSVLEDGSVGGAVCKDLTINAAAAPQKEFGITINSYGRVLVTGGAHVIDEKYNDICTDLPVGRGHIVCHNTGSVSTIEKSDGVTYEYNGDIIFGEDATLSGTVEYTGTNKVAVTFGTINVLATEIIDKPIIIGGEYVVLKNGATVFGGINVPPYGNSATPCEPDYDGSWIFMGNCANRGGTITTSGSSYVRFFDSTTNYGGGGPYGGSAVSTITSAEIVHFYNNSSNDDSGCQDQAIITNDAVFHNTSFNNGKIGGDAKFYDNSYNANCALVEGDARFYNDSYNKNGAKINGDIVEFHDNSYNEATLDNDTIEFFDYSYNNGTINSDPIFHDYSHNDEIINGDPIFKDNSYNTNTINANNIVTFENNSYNTSSGDINGNCIFNDGFPTPLEQAFNAGNIDGNCTFDGLSQNRKSITGNCIFKVSAFNIGNNAGDAVIDGDCTFYDTSCNYKGTINGNCTFEDYSGNGMYYDNSYLNWFYGGVGVNFDAEINGNCTFNNFSRNGGHIRIKSGGYCNLNNSSVNDGGYITGYYIPNYINIGYNITLNNNASNGSGPTSTRISSLLGGNVTFNTGADNFPIGFVQGNNIVFNNTDNFGVIQYFSSLTFNNSLNGITALVKGNATFNNSQNYGTVEGDAIFDATSCNSGSVLGTMTPPNPPACP